jgi:hypothetical protein
MARGGGAIISVRPPWLCVPPCCNDGGKKLDVVLTKSAKVVNPNHQAQLERLVCPGRPPPCNPWLGPEMQTLTDSHVVTHACLSQCALQGSSAIHWGPGEHVDLPFRVGRSGSIHRGS